VGGTRSFERGGMRAVLRFAWRRRVRLPLLAALLGAFLAGLAAAVRVDEGKKRHVEKRFSEALRMPGRLLT